MREGAVRAAAHPPWLPLTLRPGQPAALSPLWGPSGAGGQAQPRSSGGTEAGRPRPLGGALPRTFSAEGSGALPADPTGHGDACCCFRKAHKGGQGFAVSPTEREGGGQEEQLSAEGQEVRGGARGWGLAAFLLPVSQALHTLSPQIPSGAYGGGCRNHTAL